MDNQEVAEASIRELQNHLKAEQEFSDIIIDYITNHHDVSDRIKDHLILLSQIKDSGVLAKINY